MTHKSLARIALLAAIALPPAARTQAQPANCNDIAGVYALADWATLINGPFEPVNATSKSAPAKTVVSGFERCKVWVDDKNVANSYGCVAPAATAQGNDNKAAVEAVAAKWRSCFAGWKEDLSVQEIPGFGLRMVTISFIKDDRVKVLFQRYSMGADIKPVEIGFSR
jgi:hypothetical protein